MNLFDLTGRVAIVTGGNGGIGLGMARGLARAGADIAIAARDKGKSEAAVGELRAIGVRCEFYPVQVASRESCHAMVDAVVDELGRCDVLVNNAGMSIRKPPEQITEDEWRQVLEVNLSGDAGPLSVRPLQRPRPRPLRRGGRHRHRAGPVQLAARRHRHAPQPQA